MTVYDYLINLGVEQHWVWILCLVALLFIFQWSVNK